MKKILIILSHPADESFIAGGTIAKYAKDGWRILLVCATNGEKGFSETQFLSENKTGSTDGQTEVERAAAILGIERVRFLGLKYNALSNLTPGTFEDPLFETMLEYLPDIVITFDTTGFNNDPDHVKTCYSTTYAFQKYAEYIDELKKPELLMKGRGKEWKKEAFMRAFSEVDTLSSEPKLYYCCMPGHIIGFLRQEKQISADSFGKPWKGTADKHITTVIDIGEDKLAKGNALLCYQTQTDNVETYISYPKNPFVHQEYYMLRMQGVNEVFMGKTDRVADAL